MASSNRKRAVLAAAGAGAAAIAWKAWKNADAKRRNAGAGHGKKIVILGAGFGGMTAARELCRLTSAGPGPEIWLVDRNSFLLFTPMLTEVAGGELDPRHIVVAPSRLSPRIRFMNGDVQQIDLNGRAIVAQTGVDRNRTRKLVADHLVVALGSVPDYHHIPGLEEYSLGMKSVRDAAALHARVLRCIDAASTEPDAARRRELLTFVVGGGGYTGVETMAAVNDLARDEVRRRGLSPDEVTTIIAEPAGRLLPELSADLAAFAQRQLEANDVRVMLQTKITSASESYVEFDNGERVAARTLVWAGGVKPNPLIERLDCRRGNHGGIVVDSCCAVPGHPGVWALGDCAEVPKQRGNHTYAPTAQNATREGELVARNILAVLRGEAPVPFTFQPVGEVALVGRHSGVARLYGRQFSGLTAWAMWRAIYLSKMPGMAQRSRIALDWLLDFVFGRNPAEVPLEGVETGG